MAQGAVTAPDLHARRFHLHAEVASFGDPAVEPLAAILEEPDTALRRMVVDVLGGMGSEQAVPALIAALQAPDDSVRHQAALATVGAPAARPALEEAIRTTR